MTLPILYSFRRCPYAIRARLAVLASGLVCEIREVSLANKPHEMLTASPKATIPVMVLTNGDVLEQSLDIIGYALAQNDPEGWLKGLDDDLMALVKTNDDIFKDHLDRYKYPNRYDGDPLIHQSAGLAILTQLERRMEQFGKLSGPNYCLADIAILPFVRQFAAVDENWFAAQPIPHVRHWLADFLASPMFAFAMINLPIWRTGDEITLFPAHLERA